MQIVVVVVVFIIVIVEAMCASAFYGKWTNPGCATVWMFSGNLLPQVLQKFLVVMQLNPLNWWWTMPSQWWKSSACCRCSTCLASLFWHERMGFSTEGTVVWLL